MFESLTSKMSQAFKHITGKAKLDEKNIQDALKEVRNALIDADVALSVITAFIEKVKARALGMAVQQHLTPEQAFIKIVSEELTTIIGGEHEGLQLKSKPAVILMAGLQGAGKTTTCAKLAKQLIAQKKSVMLCSVDVYRPAAIEQLHTLCEQVEAKWFSGRSTDKPIDIATYALQQAKNEHCDVLIVDTAGRLHIDADMMTEIQSLERKLKPSEVLFVVDSMTGQDAANAAKAFHDVLTLTGVVLTKADGDARGGAALSVKHITGKPIKYIGVGEKLDALELFHPERIAQRILGMGDVLTLIEDIEAKVDKSKVEKFAKKIEKGKSFDYNDLKEQFKQMKKMGGISSLLDKLPGMSQIPDSVKQQAMDNKPLMQMESIIDSMTKKERAFPDLMATSGSRKRRVAKGAGVQLQDVQRLISQFKKMQKMMKKLKKGGIKGMMDMMGKGGGGFPGGGFPGGFGGGGSPFG